MSLLGKVALVTGADRRIGEGLIHTLAEGGAQVTVLIPSRADIPAVEHDLARSDVKAVVLACDLRYEEDVVRAVHRIGQTFGRIDVAVNATDVVGPQLGILDYPIEAWREVTAVNVTGAFLICREVLPWMLRQHSGAIINVTDRSRGKRSSAYQFSVRAVEGFTKLLAAEVAGTGVRVSVVDIAQERPARRTQNAVHDWGRTLLHLTGDEPAAGTGQGIQAGSVVS